VILDEILAHKRAEVLAHHATRGFAAALRQPRLSVIAEFKRRSPSGGEIRPGASPAQIAHTYQQSGAVALSILTDEKFFGGSNADLSAARAACDLPVLRKDFVIDEFQIYEARVGGADAILLIVRALTDVRLRSFLALAKELGMDALVETHSATEVERALAAGANIIGVNNRDLDTLVTDVSLAPRLRSMVPPDYVFVAESGISTPEQMKVLEDAGVDAVLIGESLLRAEDPGARLRDLLSIGARA
jgi:indole-3-glycerol phosphate synthase